MRLFYQFQTLSLLSLFCLFSILLLLWTHCITSHSLIRGCSRRSLNPFRSAATSTYFLFIWNQSKYCIRAHLVLFFFNFITRLYMSFKFWFYLHMYMYEKLHVSSFSSCFSWVLIHTVSVSYFNNFSQNESDSCDSYSLMEIEKQITQQQLTAYYITKTLVNILNRGL